jgi:hypothetical protein
VGKFCATCGAVSDLEIHHLDRTTKVSHRIWSWSKSRIEEELVKCEWLCGTCHDEHHSAERRAVCGTNSAYTRGCHCQACREAHAAVARGEKHRQRFTA